MPSGIGVVDEVDLHAIGNRVDPARRRRTRGPGHYPPMPMDKHLRELRAAPGGLMVPA